MKATMLYTVVLALALSTANASDKKTIYGKDTYTCADVEGNAVISMKKQIYANDACDKKFDSDTAKMICNEAMKDQGCKPIDDVPTVSKDNLMKQDGKKCEDVLKDAGVQTMMKQNKNGVCQKMGDMGGDAGPKPDMGYLTTVTCADNSAGAIITVSMGLYKYGTECKTKLDSKVATMACEAMKDSGVKCLDGVPMMAQGQPPIKDVKCDTLKGDAKGWAEITKANGCVDKKGEEDDGKNGGGDQNPKPFLAGKATCKDQDGKANVQVAVDFKKDDKCAEAIPKEAMDGNQKGATEMFKTLGGKVANSQTGVTITMDLKGKCTDSGNATLLGTVNAGFKCISVDNAQKLLPTVAAALKPLRPTQGGSTGGKSGGDKKPEKKEESSAALYAVGAAAIVAALF